MGQAWGQSWTTAWADSWGPAGGDVTVALTGTVVTSAFETLVPSSDVPLVGVEAEGLAGLVRADWHIESQTGTASVAVEIPLEGVECVTETGSVSPSQELPEVLLTGEESVFADGILTPVQTTDQDYALTGESMTAEQSVFGTMGGTYVLGGGEMMRRCHIRPVGPLVRQYIGRRRR